MRVTDLETGDSEEILDADYFKEDCYYHSFDFSLDGNQLWGRSSRLAGRSADGADLALVLMVTRSLRQPRRTHFPRHARTARGVKAMEC